MKPFQKDREFTSTINIADCGPFKSFLYSLSFAFLIQSAIPYKYFEHSSSPLELYVHTQYVQTNGQVVCYLKVLIFIPKLVQRPPWRFQQV